MSPHLQRTLFFRTVFLLSLIPSILWSLNLATFDLTAWYRTGDFVHYYGSSIAFIEGVNIYGGDLGEYYERFSFPMENVQLRATNPPTLVLLLVPFTLLDPSISFWIWNLFQVLTFAVGAWFFISKMKFPSGAIELCFISCAFVSTLPFLFHIRLGQSQLLVAGLCMGGAVFLRDRPRLGAFLLGVAISVKLFVLPVGFLIVRTGVSREKLLHFFIGLLVFPLAAEALSPQLLHLHYFAHVLPYIGELTISLAQKTSLTSAVSFFLDNFASTAAPLPHSLLAFYSTLTCGIVGVLLIGFEWIRNRNRTCPTALLGYLLAVSVLCSPVAWPHYLVLLFPAFLLLLKHSSNSSLLKGWVFFLFYVTAFTFGSSASDKFLNQVIGALWGPLLLLAVIGTLVIMMTKFTTKDKFE